MKFWKFWTYTNLILAIIVVVWFTIGGLGDLKNMFKKLNNIQRNEEDNGEY